MPAIREELQADEVKRNFLVSLISRANVCTSCNGSGLKAFYHIKDIEGLKIRTTNIKNCDVCQGEGLV